MKTRDPGMTDDHKRALRFYYPNATKAQIEKMLILMDEKGIDVPIPQPTEDMNALLGSIIRHEQTHYDAMLKQGVAKQAARDIISTRVRNTVRFLRGVNLSQGERI